MLKIMLPLYTEIFPMAESINFTSILKRKKNVSLERFSIAFTANGKRQTEISRLPKTREIYLVSAYILPVSHSYGASTKNREMS